MITDKPAKQRELTPLVQFVSLMGLIVGLIVVGGLLGKAVITTLYGEETFKAASSASNNTTETYYAAWILQILSATLPLLLAPYIFARFVVKDSYDYLRTNFQFSGKLMILVLLLWVMSSPVMAMLVDLNQRLAMPGFLKGVERWMREAEDSAQKFMAVMLRLNNTGQLLFALLIVGLLTALAEELVFRGCLQTIFERWTNNTHAAIWITAILFSAVHLQFYGFLPRLALGLFFGYFTAWSGSIWPSVWAHFINNGAQVIFLYLYQHKETAFDPDAQHTFNYTQYVLSLMVTIMLLYTYRTVALNQVHEHPEDN